MDSNSPLHVLLSWIYLYENTTALAYVTTKSSISSHFSTTSLSNFSRIIYINVRLNCIIIFVPFFPKDIHFKLGHRNLIILVDISIIGTFLALDIEAGKDIGSNDPKENKTIPKSVVYLLKFRMHYPVLVIHSDLKPEDKRWSVPLRQSKVEISYWEILAERDPELGFSSRSVPECVAGDQLLPGDRKGNFP